MTMFADSNKLLPPYESDDLATKSTTSLLAEWMEMKHQGPNEEVVHYKGIDKDYEDRFADLEKEINHRMPVATVALAPMLY